MHAKSPYSARIIGTGSAFPERILTNQGLTDELAKKGIETSHDWILERTGIVQRHISEPGNPAETNSSLGCRASQRALEMAGLGPNDIDAIFYATCTPDTLIPSTACWLQKKLGAKRAFAYDINAACSGFVYALSAADQHIRSGQIKRALVVGAEVITSFLNWDDRTSCILFGDGAGAVVVEATEESNPRRILSSHMHSDGDLWELFYMPGGGSACPPSPDVVAQKLATMQMKGKEIFKVATKTLADFAVRAIEANQIQPSQVDWIIPHQANLRIIEAVARRLDFPMERVLINVDRRGNTSAATVPTALDEAVRDGRVKPGQTLLFDVFGAGLTYGSILVKW